MAGTQPRSGFTPAMKRARPPSATAPQHRRAGEGQPPSLHEGRGMSPGRLWPIGTSAPGRRPASAAPGGGPSAGGGAALPARPTRFTRRARIHVEARSRPGDAGARIHGRASAVRPGSTNQGEIKRRVGSDWYRIQAPGARYSTDRFTARSTSSGVSSTTVLVATAPDEFTAIAIAAALSLSGKSAIT